MHHNVKKAYKNGTHDIVDEQPKECSKCIADFLQQ